MEFVKSPKNWQFSYFTEYENRPLKDGGFITWDNQRITAVSKHNVSPKEAIEFYILVESVLPQGFSSDPDIEMLSDDRISVKGNAD